MGQQQATKTLLTPFRVASTLIVLTLVIVFASCNSNDVSPTATRPAAPADPRNSTGPVLNSVPSNVMEAELRTSDGSPLKLSDYSGKVLLVNLWATWCGPCQLETPEL